MAVIHPTAIVDSQAELAQDVEIGAYSIVGPHVKIDQGTHIGAHVVIDGHTTIGKHNQIFQFSSLGAAPQDKNIKMSQLSLRLATTIPSESFVLLIVAQPRIKVSLK